MNLLNPHFVIITGDVSNKGRLEEFEVFIQETLGFTVPVFIVPGNHDWDVSPGGGIQGFTRIVNPELDFVFEYGNIIRF